jgi:RNA polymerase sigma-70 factor (ECF subfamily)
MDVAGHLPAMRRYALLLTRYPDRADDLVQDALLRAIERVHTCQRDRDLRKWLLAILHNAFVSGWRSSVAQGAALARQSSEEAHVAAPQHSRVHLGEVVEKILELPDDLLQPLALVAFEDMSYQEAAELLQIPIGTLMSRISRARAQLRESTGDESGSLLRPRFKVVK